MSPMGPGFFIFFDTPVSAKPSVEGIEYTLKNEPLHFTLSEGSELHYTLPEDSELHYTLLKE